MLYLTHFSHLPTDISTLAFYLLIAILNSVTMLLLIDKWQFDSWANTNSVLSKFWPAEPCMLCRGFWIGWLTFYLLLYFPVVIYVVIPLAAIPVQQFMYKLYLKL